MATALPGNQGRQEIADIAHKLSDGIAEGTMSAIAYAGKRYQAHGGDAAYISLSGALAALSLASMSFVKKPNLTEEEVDEYGEQEMRKLITPDGIQFASLLVSIMQSDYDPKTGRQTVEFNPTLLFEALRRWELLNPNRSADLYFDAGMLKAARDAGAQIAEAVVPFSEFLAKRAQAQQTPSSKTLN